VLGVLHMAGRRGDEARTAFVPAPALGRAGSAATVEAGRSRPEAYGGA
jgi:hypothetical protein